MGRNWLLGIGPLLLVGCIPHLETSGAQNDWEAPDNTWPVQEPPADISGEGFFEGQTVEDVRLPDQFLDEVSLWQFHGDLILLDISAVWCRPCQNLAVHTEETWLDYRDDGFTYVTVLQQNLHSEPPTQEDVQAWADEFGISAPILAEEAALQTESAVLNNNLPAVILIDRELNVVERLSSEDEEIRAAIEARL